jgi:Fic family protein
MSESLDSSAATAAELDAKYAPFLPFDQWATIQVDSTIWESRHAALVKLAEGAPQALARAVDAIKLLAAIETGAIEGLYERDRGITISVATQAAILDAALRKHENARSLIEAQLKSYDYVLDLATGQRPISEAWIRQLHVVACGAQKTYRVVTAAGEQDHELVHGQYKQFPNHVLRRDKSVHAYAPVSDTPAEMARLVAEMQSEGFQRADAALQASYVHHAFTSVHPFADGNGRVARALASVYTYRKARVPLLIVSDDKQQYFDALEAADSGDPTAFVRLVVDAGREALDLFIQNIQASLKGTMAESLAAVGRLNRTRGGLLHLDVDEAGKRLGTFVHETWLNSAAEWGKSGVISFGPATLNFPNPTPWKPEVGFRAPTTGSNPYSSITVTTSAPADATLTFGLITAVPVDCTLDDVLLVVCPEVNLRFEALMRDVYPRITMAAEARIRLWLNELGVEITERLRAQGEKRLIKRGLRPP